MTANKLLPFGVMAALIIGVLTALSVAGAIDNEGDDTFARAGGDESSVAGLCVEGVPDCVDTIVNGDDGALKTCLSEDDPAYNPDIECSDGVYTPPEGECAPGADGEPVEPCLDNPGNGDSFNMCVPGATDCNDLPLDCTEPADAVCDEPVQSIDPLQGDNPDRDLAIDAAFRALEIMGGDAGEVKVSGAEATEWDDSCLGVYQPDVACAEVITPGWTIFLSGAEDYEFHTDNNGNAAFAPQ